MALTNMKLSKKESKELNAPYEVTKEAKSREKYPWGLDLDLNTESINKLKIDMSKRRSGEKVMIISYGEVTRVEDVDEYGKDHQNLRIQMQKIGLKFGPKKDELDYDTPDDKAEEILHKRGRI